jgi:hypothetical protein
MQNRWLPKRGFFLNRNNTLQTDETYQFIPFHRVAAMQGLQALGDAPAGQSSASACLSSRFKRRSSFGVILGFAPLTLAVFVTPTSFHSASNKKAPRRGLGVELDFSNGRV